MSWKQFQGWHAYFAVEPFGEEAAWMRHGIWCSLYAAAHHDKKSGRPVPEPIDFMPFAEKPEVDKKAAVAASFQTFVGSIKTLLKPRKKAE